MIDELTPCPPQTESDLKIWLEQMFRNCKWNTGGTDMIAADLSIDGNVTITGDLEVDGAVSSSGCESVSIDDTDSPYDASATHVILVDTDSGAVTVNLPAVAESDDYRYEIKNTGTSGNDVTIDGNGAETIDNQATQAAADQDCFVVHCDGSEWHII